MTSSTETRLMPLDSEPKPAFHGLDVAGAKFVCHRLHRPAPEVVHAHHVVVQAWQEHFTPTVVVPPQATASIWDPTTVTLPPSCHYAVHNRLVRLMHTFAGLLRDPAMQGRSEDVVLAVAIGRHPHGRGSLARVAEMSPLRWLQHGLKLSDLTNAHLWGQF